MAASRDQWVYLNNGNIIYGTVENSGTRISVRTDSGEIFTYPISEVRKISDEKLNTPNIVRDKDLDSYVNKDTGLWISAQFLGAYSIMLTHTNRPLVEVNVTGGYRFNEYLKAGIGLGLRYYIDGHKIRASKVNLSMPIYANVRGNLIHGGYKTVVPYYSFDIGASVRDGFMMRPTIGIRVGQLRSAFLAGLTYMGQCYKSANTYTTKYGSFIGVTLGYEY